ncbi:MAG: DUF3987 domain-containing protein, partial [Proteobacteria bacterium]|nr:DUF3987 domain-containing protein [Pseudomonadota bacterium]
SNGVANLDLFMQAYTGDPTTVDRVSRESIRLEQPLLTMLISPQPDLLRELGEHPIFRQRGLLARIDFTMPESLVGGRDPDAPPVPPELRQAWCAALTRLLKIPMPPVGEAHTLSLSREAQAVFRPFQQTSENNLNPGEYYEDIVDWGGRVPGKAIRIAGQLHMLECAEAQTGDSWVWTDEISGPTMARAIEIASYYAEHALVVLDFMKNKGTGGDLEKVWQSIQRRGFSGFTLSDLHQSVRRQFEPPELLKVLRSLVDMNYLREVHRERTGKAGRPCSPLFETNPGKRTFNPNNTSQAAIPGNKLDSLYETEEVGFENEPTIEAAESPVTTPHVMPSGPDADCRICAVVTSGICSRHAAEAGMSFEDLP